MSQMDLFERAQQTQARRAEPIPGARYIPEFVNPNEQAALLREVDTRPWLNDLHRRVQHYGYRYDYRARRVTRDMYLGELPSFLRPLGLRLVQEGYFPVLPDQAIVNEYLPGQGISAHVDCVPCFGATIATISLGSHCEMEFQRGNEIRYQMLEIGDLLVLANEARYDWTHAIRMRQGDRGRPRKRRVSVTYRSVNREQL